MSDEMNPQAPVMNDDAGASNDGMGEETHTEGNNDEATA